MDDEGLAEKQPDISCKVCGEKKFNINAGYYYCDECGTKQDQVRQVEVIQDDEFKEGKQAKKLKVKTLQQETPQLTSWECYNYILRGLVEELLGYGAKDELKLMTLQLWAAYLRRMEVAFFNKKQPELPKLGLRYYKRDLKTLYNHVAEKRARKRKRSESSVSSKHEWRRSKRKLDESIYSVHSANVSLTSTELSQSLSLHSSSTGTTGRPIQLQFSSKARRELKKRMPPEHIKVHELDSQSLLQCHTTKSKIGDLRRKEANVYTLNIKLLYSILGIALNLIEDDIQMSDLQRFITEGHLGTKHMLKYFPENLADRRDELFQEMEQNLAKDRCSGKMLREQVAYFAELIQLREFRQPDLVKLSMRYVTDLHLPKELAVYIERLINILPPQMQTRSRNAYPAYEARAMAYVVFTLKVLFGLDGERERNISEAAQKINARLGECNEEPLVAGRQPELFVWSEWVEYVEMRKVIVSRFEPNFARQFKQPLGSAHILDELAHSQQREDDAVFAAGVKKTNAKVAAMNSLFKTLSSPEDDRHDVDKLVFVPSFTPANSYFRRIMVHVEHSSDNAVSIPQFMHTDHSKRSVEPYLSAKRLAAFLEAHKVALKVATLGFPEKRQYVGVFRVSHETKSGELLTQKPDFKVTEQEWLAGLHDELILDELEFKEKLDRYHKTYEKRLEAIAQKRRLNEEDVIVKDVRLCGDTASDVLSIHSIEVFSELNMNPIDNVTLTGPRRNLDTTDLFAGIEDEEEPTTRDFGEVKREIAEDNAATGDTLLLLQSNLDCWSLLGFTSALREWHKKSLLDKLPRSFYWLLETCAQTIGVDWSVLYEQVLVLELMFGCGIENLHDFKSYLRYKYNHPVKDLNILINLHRDIW